jgi:uncharacterized membrane protein
MEGLWQRGAGEGVLHGRLDWLVAALEWVSAGIDIAAILLLVAGALRFAIGTLRAEAAGDASARIRGLNRERMELGHYILAGLELLIVSDIIRTALSLAVADLLFLGLLVLIRSAISFFLDRELRELREELRPRPGEKEG